MSAVAYHPLDAAPGAAQVIELQQPTPAEVEAMRQAIEAKKAEIRQKDADTRRRLDFMRELYGEASQ